MSTMEKRDPNEHVLLVNERLNYFHSDVASKCKLFALTLIGFTKLWFNDLLDESIKSWTNVCKSFITHFTT